MPRNASTNTTAFTGMDRTTSIDQLRPGMMRLAQNVRFSNKGAWSMRPGFTKRHTHSAKGGYAIKGFDWPDYQALFVHMDTKILITQDGINFYDIGVTRSAVSSTFFQLGQRMFHINRTDSNLRIFTSSTQEVILDTDTSISINAGDITEFNASGTVYINGNAIAYTSVDAVENELDGVTGIPAGGFTESGLLITQTNTDAANPKGLAIDELEGSVLIGNKANHPDNISHSAAATEANPEKAWDFSGSGAGVKSFKKAVTALFSSKDVLLIGHRKGLSYSGGFGGPAGDALITGVLHDSDGVPNQQCITDMDGVTVINALHRFLSLIQSQSGGVKLLDDELNRQKNFDYPISEDLKLADYDFTLPFAHYADKRRELICGVSIDGFMYHYVFSPDSKAWSVDTGKPFTNMADFQGRTFAISQYTADIYEDAVGTNDNGAPIHLLVETGQHTQNANLATSDFTSVLSAGVISNVGDFKFKILVDGELFHEETVAADVLREQGLLLDSVAPGGTGTQNIGGSPLTNDLQETGRSRFILPYENLLVGENIQIVWETLSKDVYLEMRRYNIGAETEGELEIPNF